MLIVVIITLLRQTTRRRVEGSDLFILSVGSPIIDHNDCVQELLSGTQTEIEEILRMFNMVLRSFPHGRHSLLSLTTRHGL
ncbi:hypothetical protein [Actinomadura luteofluorescens]|uniref:hypothetical protein n=1 Tax=Actinomadura luteofluorescens TaxID=46163 RepID=UPI003D8A3723